MFSYKRNYLFINHYEKIKPLQVQMCHSCKGTFLCASSCKGSLTVEAALVLPLFLFVMMGLLSFGQMIGEHVRVTHGLVETSKEIAGEHVKQVGLLSISSKMEQYVSHMPDSINYLGSYYNEEEECYYVTGNYERDVVIPLIGTFSVTFYQRIKQRAFTGFDWKKGQLLGDADPYVYVTDTGSVYHTNRECTHVLLSVQIQLDMRPNAWWRSQYDPCEKCVGKQQGGGNRVYITDYGDKYHSSVGCSGLKRTVTRVKQSELKGMMKCQRCGTNVS